VLQQNLSRIDAFCAVQCKCHIKCDIKSRIVCRYDEFNVICLMLQVVEVELDNVIGDAPMPESVNGDFRASLAVQIAGTLPRMVTSRSMTLNHSEPVESVSSSVRLSRSEPAIGTSCNSSLSSLADSMSADTHSMVSVKQETGPSSRQQKDLVFGSHRNLYGSELLRGVEVKQEPLTDDCDTGSLHGVRVKQEPHSSVSEDVACSNLSVGDVCSISAEHSAVVASSTANGMTDTELNAEAGDKRTVATIVNNACDDLHVAAAAAYNDDGEDAIDLNVVSCTEFQSHSSEASQLPVSTADLVCNSSSSSSSYALVRDTAVTEPQELIPCQDAISKTCDILQDSWKLQVSSAVSTQTQSLLSSASCFSNTLSTAVAASVTTVSAGKCEVLSNSVCAVTADTLSKTVGSVMSTPHVTTCTVSSQPNLLAVSLNPVVDNTALSSSALIQSVAKNIALSSSSVVSTAVVTSLICFHSTSTINVLSSSALTTAASSVTDSTASSSTALTFAAASSLSRCTPIITGLSCSALTQSVTDSTALSSAALTTVTMSSSCGQNMSCVSSIRTVSSGQKLGHVRLISDKCKDQLRMTCVPPQYSKLNTAVFKPRPIVPLCSVNSPARSLPHITVLPASISSVVSASRSNEVPIVNDSRPQQRPSVSQSTATSSSSSPMFFVIGANNKVVVSSSGSQPLMEVVVIPAGMKDLPPKVASSLQSVVNGRHVINRQSVGSVCGTEAVRMSSSSSLLSSSHHSPSLNRVRKSCSSGQISLLRPQNVAVTSKALSSVEPRGTPTKPMSSGSSLNVFATKIGNQTVIVDIAGLSCSSSSSAAVKPAVTSATSVVCGIKPKHQLVSRPACSQSDVTSMCDASILPQSCSLPFDKNIPSTAATDEELKNCTASSVIRYFICFFSVCMIIYSIVQSSCIFSLLRQ